MAVERFPVESGHVLMFARAIGDPNPIYRDPEHAAGTEVGGIIAPPTFVQASAQFMEGYPLRPQPGKVWFGSGSTPSGLSKARSASSDEAEGASSGGGSGGGGGGGGGGGTGLHAEQRFEYHRPLAAGDVLTSTTRSGKTWTKQGRRGGNLRFSEMVTEYRDQDGELVVTATGVTVTTERVVEQEES